MTTLYQYRVHCISENIDVTVWSQTKPTMCPNNHSDRAIDSSRTIIVDSISSSEIVITEPTNGYFQATSIPVLVDASDDVKITDVSWPMDINIWKTEIFTNANMLNDSLRVILDPETSVGTITDDALTGANVLSVQPSVLAYVSLGTDITISDNTKKQDLGRAIAINTTNNTLTVEKATTSDFYQASPSLILINQCMIRDVYIDRADKTISFGEKGFRGAEIPANTKLRVKYNNLSGKAKTFYFRVEYYYEG